MYCLSLGDNCSTNKNLAVLEEFLDTGLVHYLGTDKDNLTHYPDFEVSFVENFSGAPLSKTQKEALKGLLELQKDNTEETSVDSTGSILNAKKRKGSGLGGRNF